MPVCVCLSSVQRNEDQVYGGQLQRPIAYPRCRIFKETEWVPPRADVHRVMNGKISVLPGLKMCRLQPGHYNDFGCYEFGILCAELYATRFLS